ncbi:transcription factor 23 isoform X1 [Oryctolagus cuniculus]|uniref:transcription factor 23 isoform X1 n=1 Tax=Oryctolagus cuniculus TaxID=9986 RepID=UPI00387A2240
MGHTSRGWGEASCGVEGHVHWQGRRGLSGMCAQGPSTDLGPKTEALGPLRTTVGSSTAQEGAPFPPALWPSSAWPSAQGWPLPACGAPTTALGWEVGGGFLRGLCLVGSFPRARTEQDGVGAGFLGCRHCRLHGRLPPQLVLPRALWSCSVGCSLHSLGGGMSQREAREAPATPGAGHGRAKARARGLPGTAEKRRSRLCRTRQDPWEETNWNTQSWGWAAPNPRGARAGGRARGRQSEASPENAARERSRVRTLRQAFLALQAALPAVPPDTKLSKLDVLVLATSYIAHLTRTLGHELPGPAWPPFLRGLRYLHPLKKWPMRSRLYAGGLGCSGLDATPAATCSPRMKDVQVQSQDSEEAEAGLSTKPLPPALGDK